MRPGIYRLPSGLQVFELRRSDGIPADLGDELTMHYRIALDQEFSESAPKWIDDSWARNEPVNFRLGLGEVLRGIDEGAAGMRLASERRLIVPPHLAFGDRGSDSRVPGMAALVIDLYLADIGKDETAMHPQVEPL